MSSSSSLRTFAPIWVGVAAFTVLVWELAAHGTLRDAEATPAADPDFVRISLSNSSHSAAHLTDTPDSLDGDRVATWDSQHRSIDVRIDPLLGRSGIRDQDFRAAANARVSARPEPFSWSALVDGGQLVVVSGRGNGFSGTKTELRFTSRADGTVAGEGATCCFVDVWPTDDFWTELSGHAVLSTNSWKHGDVLFLEYEVCGTHNGVPLVDSGRLRVELPR